MFLSETVRKIGGGLRPGILAAGEAASSGHPHIILQGREGVSPFHF
jgi:hypothetical protein